MAFTAYADQAALAEWLRGPLPADWEQLLRSATFVVAKACNRNPYSDTPTGSDVEVLSDATCAQVASWVANNVNPAAGGLDVRVVTESKLGSGDVKLDALTAEQVAEAVTCLTPEVAAILQSAGLLWLSVPAGADPCDGLYDFGLDGPCLASWV